MYNVDMNIRQTHINDIDEVMNIYQEDRSFMRLTGNHNQWVNNYPPQSLILEDIEKGQSYVILNEENEIVGVMMYAIGNDPTYNVIEGAWLNDEPYGVIHRIASKINAKGIGKFCFDWALNQCPNLRIDTHEENRVMRDLLTRFKFTECGIIYLVNNEPRIAYHKRKESE